MKWITEDPDENSRLYRACMFCGGRLRWRYDNERDFTLGVPQCSAHGQLNTWVIRSKTHVYGAGRLTEPGILCDDGEEMVAFTVTYNNHRFKAVAQKRALREKSTELLNIMEVKDVRH